MREMTAGRQFCGRFFIASPYPPPIEGECELPQAPPLEGNYERMKIKNLPCVGKVFKMICIEEY